MAEWMSFIKNNIDTKHCIHLSKGKTAAQLHYFYNFLLSMYHKKGILYACPI